MNFKGVIFDLDGTLLDSMHVWQEVDRKFFEQRGLIQPTNYCDEIAAMGLQMAAEYTISRFKLKDTPAQLVTEWTGYARLEYAENVDLTPFAREFLEALRIAKIPLAVATTCHRELYLPALVHNGINGFFDAVIDPESCPHGKSSPAIYLAAAEKIGASPSDCVVFEDVPEAAQTALSAGFQVIGVAGDKRLRDICPRCISSFEEILNEVLPLEI